MVSNLFTLVDSIPSQVTKINLVFAVANIQSGVPWAILSEDAWRRLGVALAQLSLTDLHLHMVTSSPLLTLESRIWRWSSVSIKYLEDIFFSYLSGEISQDVYLPRFYADNYLDTTNITHDVGWILYQPPLCDL